MVLFPYPLLFRSLGSECLLVVFMGMCETSHWINLSGRVVGGGSVLRVVSGWHLWISPSEQTHLSSVFIYWWIKLDKRVSYNFFCKWVCNLTIWIYLMNFIQCPTSNLLLECVCYRSLCFLSDGKFLFRASATLMGHPGPRSHQREILRDRSRVGKCPTGICKKEPQETGYLHSSWSTCCSLFCSSSTSCWKVKLLKLFELTKAAKTS